MKKESDIKERKTKNLGKFNDKEGSWKGQKKGGEEPKNDGKEGQKVKRKEWNREVERAS